MTTERGAEGREQRAVPPAPAPRSGSEPPPRPAMPRSVPAPIARATRPSAVTRSARALWALSAFAGILALVVVFLRRTDQFGLLRTFIEETQPGYGQAVDTAAAVAFFGTASLFAVLLCAELLLSTLLERSSGARWWMLVLLTAHAAVAVALIPFVALGAEGTSTRLLILAELVLGGFALLLGAVGAAVNRRRPRGPEPGPERRQR